MKFNVVSELAGGKYIYKLTEDMKSIAEKVSKNNHCLGIDLIVAIRCRSKKFPRRTFSRYYKNEKLLSIDIAFLEDEFIEKLKCEQRHEFSHKVFDYIKESIEKHVKNKEDVIEFLKDLRFEMESLGWLEDEIDYSDPSAD